MKCPMTVVYVAAEADEPLRRRLESHLALLEQQGLMQGWHIQQIPAGSVEAESRDAALQKASLVLLLISADFFASSVCQEQMQRALERQKRGAVLVIPILARRVDGKGALFAHLQALPKNGKPIASWANEDEALAEVAEGIRRVLEEDQLPAVDLTSSVRTKEQWVSMSQQLYHGGYSTEALRACEQAIDLDPEDAIVSSNKGLILYSLKRYEEALSACERAIDLDPRCAYAYNNKSLVLCDLKRYEEALSACEQAIDLDSKLTVAYHQKGNVLYDLKRYEEALRAFDQTIELDPKLADAYHSKGTTFFALKRYKEALSALEQAIDLDPKLASTYRDKGLTLDRLGRYTEAKQAYEKTWQVGMNR